ncbi:MAG: class I SAM-dependent methyltransferase, partial [Planctomycetia bacterium]
APQPLWRECSDRHQAALIARWLHRPSEAASPAPGPEVSMLKTDLFDEVAGRGVVQFLLAEGVRVTGIDISSGVVTEASARNPGLEAVVADVRCLPFAEAAFDVVFSGSTLDHFESVADIQAALGEICRVLRPGGTLILTLDNLDNPVVWRRNGPLLGLLRRIGIVPYQVGATLGHSSLESHVRAAGFAIVESTAVVHCPRVLAVAVAGVMERLGRSWQEAFIRGVASWESLGRRPTRWLTGHYVAIQAVKPNA